MQQFLDENKIAITTQIKLHYKQTKMATYCFLPRK